jgi:hypothetical protein
MSFERVWKRQQGVGAPLVGDGEKLKLSACIEHFTDQIAAITHAYTA